MPGGPSLPLNHGVNTVGTVVTPPLTCRWMWTSLRTNSQTPGGARLSTVGGVRQGPRIACGGSTAATSARYAAVTVASGCTTAAVGDVRLTIKSSKSALSDTPLGPSASIGVAW